MPSPLFPPSSKPPGSTATAQFLSTSTPAPSIEETRKFPFSLRYTLTVGRVCKYCNHKHETARRLEGLERTRGSGLERRNSKAFYLALRGLSYAEFVDEQNVRSVSGIVEKRAF